MPDTSSRFLASVRTRFAQYKRMGEDAMAQVADEAFVQRLGPESEPLAIIVKHVGGNLRSRWLDFLATDGNKPDRKRDTEFELAAEDTRESLMERWETGWRYCLDSLDALTESDLNGTVTIRGEPLTVIDAIHRSLAHTAYHVGQIVYLAKHHLGSDWQTLSIPRGQSDEYDAALRAKHG